MDDNSFWAVFWMTAALVICNIAWAIALVHV